MLEVYRELPDRFFDLQAHQLHEVMQGPALFHLRGRRFSRSVHFHIAPR